MTELRLGLLPAGNYRGLGLRYTLLVCWDNTQFDLVSLVYKIFENCLFAVSRNNVPFRIACDIEGLNFSKNSHMIFLL